MKGRALFFSALLGIAIGVLSVLILEGIGRKNRLLRVSEEDWRKLNLILQTVDENYVDSVDREKVTEAAVAAALAALDPHSVYMPPRQLEEAEEGLSGNFSGIGIQFNVPNDTAIVIEVIPGGPAEKIGMQAGDRLLLVDTTVIAGVHFPQDSMVRRIKGPTGTPVVVTVLRGRERIPFVMKRGRIPTHSVDAAFMVSDTTGYLRLGKFSRTTCSEVSRAARDLQKAGMRELVLDLRGNSGGYFDQAFSLADLFLRKNAPIVYMEGRHRERETYEASGKGFLQDIGLKVLIDDSTASSSEIFAGAIQDNRRGLLVGRRTFGKGLVQEPVNFTDGSGIRITVARFYTPSGRCIQKPYGADYNYEVYARYGNGEMVDADSMKVEKGGILPDVFVPLDTTRVGAFYQACNRKAVPMRFASA
ncbi:MAG: PDZ domain-containing protein [Bacteroidales bacterium]|nr:PDZ domain-containing protein [Bacteroidales bacterium]